MKLGRFTSEAGHSAYVRAYNSALAELPRVSSTQDLRTRFGRVRTYEWLGTEPGLTPVLLLPGRSSGVPMWADNLPGLLSTGRTIIAMDALGDAGLSVQTDAIRSFADQAAWVEEALRSLGVARVHVVGHSFGGATAAAHAVHYGARQASLTLLEPAFTLGWPPVSTFFWATAVMLPVPQSLRDRALAAIGGVSVDEVRQRTPMSEMISAGAQHFKAALPTPLPLSRRRLESLSMPTYVSIADHKSLAGGEKAARRARLIPRVQVETWPDTTHSLPMQVSDALAKRLATFWRDADSAE